MGDEVLSPGAALRVARQFRGVRSQELARLLGLAPSYVSNIEMGRKRLTPEVAAQAALRLRVPVAMLQRPRSLDETQAWLDRLDGQGPTDLAYLRSALLNLEAAAALGRLGDTAALLRHADEAIASLRSIGGMVEDDQPEPGMVPPDGEESKQPRRWLSPVEAAESGRSPRVAAAMWAVMKLLEDGTARTRVEILARTRGVVAQSTLDNLLRDMRAHGRLAWSKMPNGTVCYWKTH